MGMDMCMGMHCNLLGISIAFYLILIYVFCIIYTHFYQIIFHLFSMDLEGSNNRKRMMMEDNIHSGCHPDRSRIGSCTYPCRIGIPCKT